MKPKFNVLTFLKYFSLLALVLWVWFEFGMRWALIISALSLVLCLLFPLRGRSP